MKIGTASILTVCAALLTPMGVVRAAECTEAQLRAVDPVAMNAGFAKACASLLAASSTPSTVIDATTLASMNPCADPTCVAFIKKFVGDLPACEIMGFSLKASYGYLSTLCEGTPPAGPPPPMVTTRNNTAINSTDTDTGMNSTATTPATPIAEPAKATEPPSSKPASSAVRVQVGMASASVATVFLVTLSMVW